ncbi:MAG: hypothetical protein GTO13_23375 [Proteobacteria bacterium]|nr:hypothetical protein [Pseudomonadota bacterium]
MTKVGGEISWRVRPRDTKANRMIVAESLLDTLNVTVASFHCREISFRRSKGMRIAPEPE